MDISFQVTVLGTPAEEGGGGKIDMINANVFKDVDVAMMAHPIPYNASTFDALAIDRYVTWSLPFQGYFCYIAL